MNTIIRKGTERDIPALMQLIQELADFEKAPQEVANTGGQLKSDFLEHKAFDFLVAEVDGEVVGISLYYPRYSTWKGRCMYLEDLCVKSNFRGQGIGKKLLQATADEAQKAGAIRLDWQVLDWNTSASDFYKKMGAAIETEWWNCKWRL